MWPRPAPNSRNDAHFYWANGVTPPFYWVFSTQYRHTQYKEKLSDAQQTESFQPGQGMVRPTVPGGDAVCCLAPPTLLDVLSTRSGRRTNKFEVKPFTTITFRDDSLMSRNMRARSARFRLWLAEVLSGLDVVCGQPQGQ